MNKSNINRVTKPISRKSADQVMEALQYKNIEPGDCLKNTDTLTSLLKKIKIGNHPDLSFAHLIKNKINLDWPLGQGGFGSAFLVDIEKNNFLKVFPNKKWEDHEEFVLKVIDLGAGYEKDQSKIYKEYRNSMQKELEIANKIKDLDKEEEFFSKIYLTGTTNYETSRGKSYDIEVILMKGYRTTLEDYAKSNLSTETQKDAIECLDTTIQIGKGIKILHDHEIIHKDIKPLNIFYDSKKEKVYLGDFGSARQLSDYIKEDNSYNYNTVVPTYSPDYSPPEICFKNNR